MRIRTATAALAATSLAAVAGLTAASASAAVISPSTAASTSTLAGDWAPFSRCPVDSPSMLAADGKTVVADCNTSDSPSGSIKLGNTTAATGDSPFEQKKILLGIGLDHLEIADSYCIGTHTSGHFLSLEYARRIRRLTD